MSHAVSTEITHFVLGRRRLRDVLLEVVLMHKIRSSLGQREVLWIGVLEFEVEVEVAVNRVM